MLERRKVEISKRGEIKNHRFKGYRKAGYVILKEFQDETIVYFDPDVDGVIAGYLACKFLSMHGKKFSWYINSNRSHDWSLPLSKIKGRDILAVDFLISAEKIAEICEAGCNIISMDHHINRDKFVEYESDMGTYGCVINNQYPFEEEDGRYLSGAGVVFETLVQIDKSFDTPLNRALVGITLLSDIRNIENPLAEGYLYTLYSSKYKGFIQYLIETTIGDKDYGFGVPRLDRNYVDFKFSPAINACLRFNQQDSVVNYILGCGKLNLVWRDEQKKLVKEIMKKLKRYDFGNIIVSCINEEDFVNYKDVLSNFVGLTASQTLDGKHSAICYLLSESNGVKRIKRASFRGKINGLDYNHWLGELFSCAGHDSAFGIKGLVPSKKLFIEANKICTDVEESSSYSRKIIEVTNMSMFVGNNAFRIAEDNMYKLSQNQVVVKYTGNSIKKKREGASFIEYEVNGIPVMCFDLKKSFKTDYITPVLDRGMLTFYLE